MIGQNFHFVSLGCAKNLVDTEVMLGALASAGFRLVEAAEDASYLLINTCGFIQPAVEEAIEEILALAEIKNTYPDKRLIVIGCLVERYREKLLDELPEVDLFIGTESASYIGQLIADLANGETSGETSSRLHLAERGIMSSDNARVLTTGPFRSWLKITEGCNNRCSYCMIPAIRGPLRSRTIDDLVREAQRLEAAGVKELSLIGQDITAYGRDRDGKSMLVELVQNLLNRTGIPWIRLLYLYPTGIDAALIRLMAENPRVMPYLDLPLQHISDRMLKRMNRHYDSDVVRSVIKALRSKIPDIALRTTFLVGFPGEEEADLQQIADFLREIEFDHVGVFAYADEEGAPSAAMQEKISEAECEQRRSFLLELQKDISERRLRRFVGTVQPVLIEGVSEETDLLLVGRTRYQAPEVDGCVYINDGTVTAGEITPVLISEAQVYDLVGGVVSA